MAFCQDWIILCNARYDQLLYSHLTTPCFLTFDFSDTQYTMGGAFSSTFDPTLPRDLTQYVDFMINCLHVCLYQ